MRPCLADLLGLFLAVAVTLVGASRLFGDSDAAMHVATGRFILDRLAVPRVDPFSATHAGGEWFAHEWLADVGWALVHRLAGWPGLVAWSAALLATTHVLLYRFLVRRGHHALPAFFATTAAATVAASHWLARPHLLTGLLLVIWTATIDGFASGRTPARRLALLPLLAALWANLHGGFLVAFPVLAVYVVAALRERPDRARPLLLAGLGAAAATLANPWGYRLHAHLVAYFAAPREALARNEEFAPASLADRAGAVFFAVAALTALVHVAGAALRRSGAAPGSPPPGIGALLAFGMTAAMAATSIRHASLAAIFAAIVLSAGLSALLERVSPADARAEWVALRDWESRSGGALFAGSLVALAALAAGGLPRDAGYDPRSFPVEMVRSLHREGLVPDGPLFSLDLWGGLIVLEWPEARVFVDGRSDMYGDEAMRRYGELYEADAGWSSRLADAGVRWALLPPAAPLAAALRADRSWETARADPTAILFRRLGAAP